MAKQELFDKVVSAIIKQGKASVDERGDCMYRGPNGCKCAAGYAIPDEVYDSQMEGQLVGDITVFLSVNGVPLFDEGQILLLEELQSCHDEAYNWQDDDADFVGQFKARAGVAADKFGLNRAVLQ